MRVRVRVRGAVVRVRLVRHRDGDETRLAVFDVALGDHRFGKLPDPRSLPAQHRDFETIVVVEMNMHRRDLKIVMIVVRVGQPLRQLARVVIEDVGQRRDALSLRAVVDSRLLETEARQVAQRLGSIVIVVIVHERGEFLGKLVGHADGDPLHVLGLSNSADGDDYDVSIGFSRAAARDKPPRSSAPLPSLRPARSLAGDRSRLVTMPMMAPVLDRVAMVVIMRVGNMGAFAERRVFEDFVRRAGGRHAA